MLKYLPVLAAACAAGSAWAAEGPASPAPAALTVGVAQMSPTQDLARNRQAVIRFIAEAKARGCRAVIFPEGALDWPPATTRAEIDAAVAAIARAADDADIYVVLGLMYKRTDGERPYNRLVVADPDGRIIHTYDKLWSDARFPDVPGLFRMDGAACNAIICADRWIRGVGDLPAVAGSQVIIECSNNYANEWLPDLEWYWYVPRALRNGAYVIFANTPKQRGPLPGHGHSAVIAPDGSIVVTAGEEADRLLVATLDLAKATRSEALRRRNHPVFKRFWDAGLAILAGRQVAAEPFAPLSSPQVAITMAAAQMACSADVEENAARIVRLVRQARAGGADIVVFPELALTGAADADVLRADAAVLDAALARICAAARAENITVVVGMPLLNSGRRCNGAVAIGPDGAILTRYAALVVDRPDLFAQGTSTRAMWFSVKGAPAVVTVGRDALWSEIAELAAVRGAQVHVHLAYDRDVSPAAALRRKQLWVNLASFRTFTATVNAASPAGLARPSAPASGGSAIWEDFRRNKGKGGPEGYAPYSAVRLAEAGQGEQVICATQTVMSSNGHFRAMTQKTNPQMKPWYETGGQVIAAEVPSAPASGAAAVER